MNEAFAVSTKPLLCEWSLMHWKLDMIVDGCEKFVAQTVPDNEGLKYLYLLPCQGISRSRGAHDRAMGGKRRANSRITLLMRIWWIQPATHYQNETEHHSTGPQGTRCHRHPVGLWKWYASITNTNTFDTSEPHSHQSETGQFAAGHHNYVHDRRINRDKSLVIFWT